MTSGQLLFASGIGVAAIGMVWGWVRLVHDQPGRVLLSPITGGPSLPGGAPTRLVLLGIVLCALGALIGDMPAP